MPYHLMYTTGRDVHLAEEGVVTIVRLSPLNKATQLLNGRTGIHDFSLKFILLIICVCIHTHDAWECELTDAIDCVWRSEGNPQPSVLFYHCGIQGSDL